jgi:HEAT repeat protein
MKTTIRSGALIPLLAVFFLAGCAKSTDDIIKNLSSESYVARMQAAARLISEKNPGTTKKLIERLSKGGEREAFIISQILGNRGDTTAIAPLGRLSKSPNIYIRARALWSIGNIGHESGLPYLVEGLKDSVAMVRHSAVTAIGFLHYPPAVSHLYPMLRDEADSVRSAAVRSIYNFRGIPGSGVLAADLATAVNDPAPVVRYVAVQALGGGFPDTTTAGELLVEALRDDNKYVRIEAITSIKNIRYKKAAPILKQMFDTASVDEEYSISDAIMTITGETYPPDSGK